MCGRYFMDEHELELREILAELNGRMPTAPVKTAGEVFPGDAAPVLAPDRARRPGVFAMRWGYTLPDGRRIINARSETAAERPLFRDGMARRRCVVPASHYFEWARRGRARTRYAVRAREGGMLRMAGVYRLEGDRPVFAILTRAPAPEIAFIHDRMPVLLPPSLTEAWLDAAADPGSILAQALREVAFEKSPGATEQLGMEL